MDTPSIVVTVVFSIILIIMIAGTVVDFTRKPQKLYSWLKGKNKGK